MPGKSAAQQQAEEMGEAEGREAESQYHPGFNRRATDYCMLGATNDDLARFFSVNVSAISQWLVEIPSFAKAVAKGREVADIKVAKALFHRASGYSHKETKVFQFEGELQTIDVVKHYPPETNAAALWLTNRQRDKWRQTDRGGSGMEALPDFLAAIMEAADKRKIAKAVPSQPGDDAKLINPLPVVTDEPKG